MPVRLPAVLQVVDRLARLSDVLIRVKHNEPLSQVVRLVPVVNAFIQVYDHGAAERFNVECVHRPRKTCAYSYNVVNLMDLVRRSKAK